MSLTHSPAAYYDTIMVLTKDQEQRLEAIEASPWATPGGPLKRLRVDSREWREVLKERGWRALPPNGQEYIPPIKPKQREFVCKPISIVRDRTTYVYAWYINDEVVYVGQGIDGRAWRYRAAEYAVMCLVPGFAVKILAYVATATEARRVESALINRWKPRYNSTIANRVTYTTRVS